MPYTFLQQHVKSHQQDGVDDPTTLPLPIYINQSCDHSANRAHQCTHCPEPSPPPAYPSTHAYLKFSTYILSSKLDLALRHKSQDILLLDHITQCGAWSSTIRHKVHWKAIQQALAEQVHTSATEIGNQNHAPALGNQQRTEQTRQEPQSTMSTLSSPH